LNRTFGRDNARKKLDSLIAKLEKLALVSGDRDVAISFAIESWHLCDWVFKEAGQQIGHNSLRSLQDEIRAQCPKIEIMRDICTEDKHSEIRKWVPIVRSTHQKFYVDPGYVKKSYVEEQLVVISNDGIETAFIDCARDVVDFWQAFFLNHGLR
jgi:hypothetical protein